MKAVWTSYAALHRHFSTASIDDTRDASAKAKYTGLLSRLTSKAFVGNLGIMMDALTELADLSRELQKREMTLPRAQKLIDRQIRVLESMAESCGHVRPNPEKQLNPICVMASN